MIHPMCLFDPTERSGSVAGRLFADRLDLRDRGRFDVVIDTDPYNEVDDQFAIAYALLSPDRLNVEAMYAAPFHNHRSRDAADGMERSYHEIHRVLRYLPDRFDGIVCRGATAFLTGASCAPGSDAVLDLIERGMAPRDEPLYVIAIAALTNIASALILEPRLRDRLVVVWLGGQPSSWHTAHEFNLRQDAVSARVVLDCGVPLIRIPCNEVAQRLDITVPELEATIGGAGELGRYLCGSVRDYLLEIDEPSKAIWDLSAVAALVNPSWVPTSIVRSPILTATNGWAFDRTRHLGAEATGVERDAIFTDLWSKLSGHGNEEHHVTREKALAPIRGTSRL